MPDWLFWLLAGSGLSGMLASMVHVAREQSKTRLLLGEAYDPDLEDAHREVERMLACEADVSAADAAVEKLKAAPVSESNLGPGWARLAVQGGPALHITRLGTVCSQNKKLEAAMEQLMTKEQRAEVGTSAMERLNKKRERELVQQLRSL